MCNGGMLNRIFTAETQRVKENWRKSHNKGIHGFEADGTSTEGDTQIASRSCVLCNVYRTVVRMSEDEMSTGLWTEYVKEKGELEDLGVDGIL